MKRCLQQAFPARHRTLSCTKRVPKRSSRRNCILPRNDMPILRVGTDYSGIETPIMALQKLKVPHNHVFSSEIDASARKVIQTRFKPGILYGNTLDRSYGTLPRIDFYVAGFPCQLFSTTRTHHIAGMKTDPLVHFYACLRTIEHTRPLAFVLENVMGLKSVNNGKYFEIIKKKLEALQSYHITIFKLNARDYGSIQNRKRLYFVGIRGDAAQQPLLQVVPVHGRNQTFEKDILEKQAIRRKLSPVRAQFLHGCTKNLPYPVFMSLTDTRHGCQVTKLPPCLTRSGIGLFWSGKGGIVTTVREQARLQGIPDTFKFPEGMSETVCRQLIGNAMSVDTLRALFASILKHIKWKRP